MKLNNIPSTDRIYNLRFVQRYSLTPRITSETVAEHSFFVCAFVLDLHKIYGFDLGKAITMAHIHDYAECEIGDITLTAKLNHPTLVKEVEKAERKVMKSFGEPIYSLYEEYIARESVESLIVKYADILQVRQYLRNEAKIGQGATVDNMAYSTEALILKFQNLLSEFIR